MSPNRSGTRSRAPAQFPPGSVPATRFASKPRCRCTVTSSVPASRRCKPGWAGWSRWDKGEFPGRDALVAERERGVHRRLVGISTPSRRPPRAGYPILVDGAAVGEVTSGNYSPVLEHGIALGFVPPDVAVGDEVAIDVRGNRVPGRGRRDAVRRSLTQRFFAADLLRRRLLRARLFFVAVFVVNVRFVAGFAELLRGGRRRASRSALVRSRRWQGSGYACGLRRT